ncbi:hypothetical protein [Viridibacterium curvum]|uniref:Uncharacterized protein n=1 Tax=Viridibacterium curvum TaxID=1101404 RepID=A0ABP9QIW3_9RHOO
MKNLLRVALCALFGALAAPVLAQQTIQFDGCKDRLGAPVPTVVDTTLRAVAKAVIVDGKGVIRHNPEMLPRLLPESRLFVFAHECGRQLLGFAPDADLQVAQVRQADCWAVDVLQRSGLLKDKTLLATIEDDLSMVPDDWALLPGPRRVLALGSCKPVPVKQGQLKVDTGAAPTEKWNACQQGCASKLFSCGRGANCQSAFEQCSASCGAR